MSLNPLRGWMKDAKATPDTRHVDTCDGLRAAAILIVGWYHIWQQSWLSPSFVVNGHYVSFDPLVRSGYMWVDVMILISGFCLYLPWARLQEGESRPDTIDFYARRLMRVHPSYLLAVFVMLLVALAKGVDHAFLARDLITHLTYTHTFFYDTYYATNLGGTLWTLAIEMQFYLLFPWIARNFKRAPAVTFLAMTSTAIAFRLYVGMTFADISMTFNQLPAFLDVFALGMAAAQIHVLWAKRKHGPVSRVLCSLGVVFVITLIWRVVRMQAMSATTAEIRQGQMDHRIMIAGLAAALLVLSANAGFIVRHLFSNPVTRFISSVSMQFYIWHQTMAVWFLQWRVVPSALEHPNYDGDRIWQMRYTILCFVAAFAVAAVLTYGFERPVARALRKRFDAWRHKKPRGSNER